MQHSIFTLLYLKIWVLMTAFNFQFVRVNNIQLFTVLMCEPSLLRLNLVTSCLRFEWLVLIFNVWKCAWEVGWKMHAPNSFYFSLFRRKCKKKFRMMNPFSFFWQKRIGFLFSLEYTLQVASLPGSPTHEQAWEQDYPPGVSRCTCIGDLWPLTSRSSMYAYID